jgi:hypothetical protein
MECDSAVKIPEKYDKMNLSEITAEFARLSKEKICKKRLNVKQNLLFNSFKIQEISSE